MINQGTNNTPTPIQTSLGKRQDELIALLENEEDFSSSKTLLEEELEKRGAKCIFTPKFHPELNPVELCYRFFNTNNTNKGRVTTTTFCYISVFCQISLVIANLPRLPTLQYHSNAGTFQTTAATVILWGVQKDFSGGFLRQKKLSHQRSAGNTL